MSQQFPKMPMNADDLYREETFSDQRTGTIRRLTPVKPDGSDDTARKTLFVGQAQLYTQAGPMPLTFEIPADNLQDAVAAFEGEAHKAIEDTIRQIEEMRREEASRIVVPGAGGGRGGMGGGMPGGGGIQLP